MEILSENLCSIKPNFELLGSTFANLTN